MTRAGALVNWAEDHIGHAYVFGAAGQKCTPSYRRGVAENKPLYAESITKNCPVLSGKQSTCTGCKYNGKNCYDCRGLTREGIRAVTGRPVMGAGATSQWNDNTNWAEKGPIANIPTGKPCLVFVKKENTMSHTGIYIGSAAIHASGHGSGVIKSAMPRTWTHYAIPVGLYDEEKDMPTDPYLIRSKDKGPHVVEMQKQLMAAGYPLPRYGADGSFGAETLAAVQAFQRDFDQPVDGAWDSECQAEMDRVFAPIEPLPLTGLEEVELLLERALLAVQALRG